MIGPFTHVAEPKEMTIGEKYKYALGRIEKTKVKSPGIAAVWEKEAELLRARLGTEE